LVEAGAEHLREANREAPAERALFSLMRRKLELHPEGCRSGSMRQMPRIRLLAVTASAALAFCAAAGASPDEVLYDQQDNAGPSLRTHRITKVR
jgi:hypothetical protein